MNLRKGKKIFLITSKGRSNETREIEEKGDDQILFPFILVFTFFTPKRCGIKSVSDCINMIFDTVISVSEDAILACALKSH